MYIQTRSKTITEATNKMLAVKNNLVRHCSFDDLSEAQQNCLCEYFHEMCFGEDDKRLALTHLYVDIVNNHIYVMEICDDADDTPLYYYETLIPTVTLYKDDLGNLYYDNGLFMGAEPHQLILVEKENGHYIYTQNTWYEDGDRLATLYTKIEAEVR